MLLSVLQSLDLRTLLGLQAAALIAGLARGFSGFGAALIFVPLASIVVAPQVAAPLLLIADGVMALGMLPGAARLARRRDAYLMAAGALAGIPAGTWILAQSDPVLVRWIVCLLVFGLLALLVSGLRWRADPVPPLTVLTGAVSGLFNGLAQVGGPPVIAYWLGGQADPRRVRANIVFYFGLSTAITAVAYWLGDLLTREVALLALATAPIFGLGLWIGSHLFGRASERLFRRLSYALIAAAGLLGLPAFDGLLR